MNGLEKLKEIKAPNLNSADYASNINEAFENINYNFTALSNYDFIAGRDGNNIYIENVEYSEDDKNKPDYYTKIRKAIESAIMARFNVSEEDLGPLADVDGKHFSDSLNNFKLSLLYELDTQSGTNTYKKYIGSLPYIFIDARFLGKLNDGKEYSDKIDASSALYLESWVETTTDENNWTFACVDAFPTLYFDDDINRFCWKIYGQESGLIANGPAGKDGENGDMAIVQISEDTMSDNVYVISKVWEYVADKGYYEWVNAENIDIDYYNGKNAIVFSNKISEVIEDSSSQELEINDGYWVSSIYTTSITDDNNIKEILVVACDDGNFISARFNVDALYYLLKKINSSVKDKSVDKGIFIPFEPVETTANNVGIHMIYNINGDNEQEDTEYYKKQVLVVEPKNNILNLENYDAKSMPVYDGKSELLLNYDEIKIKGCDDTIQDTVANLVGKKSQNGEIFNNYVNNRAYQYSSHAEGQNTMAVGMGSHAEGGTDNNSHSDVAADLSINDSYITLTNNTITMYNRSAWGGSTSKIITLNTGELYLVESGGDVSAVILVNSMDANFGTCSIETDDSTRLKRYNCNSKYYITTLSNAQNYNGPAKIYYINGGAIGHYSHTEGYNTKTIGEYSHAEGDESLAFNTGSHAEGYATKALGEYSHAEGYSTSTSGNYSHSEGQVTTASGKASHAEGGGGIANGTYSHVGGYGTYNELKADSMNEYYSAPAPEETGNYIGTINISSKNLTGVPKEGYTNEFCHVIITPKYICINSDITVQGENISINIRKNGRYIENESTKNRIIIANNVAYGTGSFVTGNDCLAFGDYSTAFGSNNTVNGSSSFVTGSNNTVNGSSSFVTGSNNTSNSDNSFSTGTYNYEIDDSYFTVGVGQQSTSKSNAICITSNGNIYIKNIGWYEGKEVQGENSQGIEIKSFQDYMSGIESRIKVLEDKIKTLEGSKQQ